MSCVVEQETTQMNTENEPWVPWTMLQQHVMGRSGRPISYMTLSRWRERGVIRVHQINGSNYIKLQQELARIAPSAADTTS